MDALLILTAIFGFTASAYGGLIRQSKMSPPEVIMQHLAQNTFGNFFGQGNYNQDYHILELCLAANSFIVSDFILVDTVDALQHNLQNTCASKSEILHCLDEFSDSYKTYLEPNETDYLNKYKAMLRRLADYVCHDNGAKILTLRKPESFNCFESSAVPIRNCMAPIGHQYLRYSFSDMHDLFSANECANMAGDLAQMKNCFVPNLAVCSPEVSVIFGEFMSIVFGVFSCDI